MHLIYRRASVSLSSVYFHFRHNQQSLYINLVCFESISTKDNLVQLSGTIWQAFCVCALFIYFMSDRPCLETKYYIADLESFPFVWNVFKYMWRKRPAGLVCIGEAFSKLAKYEQDSGKWKMFTRNVATCLCRDSYSTECACKRTALAWTFELCISTS